MIRKPVSGDAYSSWRFAPFRSLPRAAETSPSPPNGLTPKFNISWIPFCKR